MLTESVEEILREKYCSYRRARGKKKIYIEVPVFSRSVDLVELDGHSRKITAVEFKITDWKRALKRLSITKTCSRCPSFAKTGAVCKRKLIRQFWTRFSVL